MRPELAALTRERDTWIRELQNAHWRAEAYELAARDQPRNLASAHERQAETAASLAFARDRYSSRHAGRAQPEPAGRNVHDTWVW
jgi:hypothetical protein